MAASQNREVSMRLSLRDRQKFTRETKAAEGSVEGIGDKFGELGNKAKAGMLAAAAAIGIGVGLVGKAFADSKSNDKLAGQLGLTPAQAKKYGKVAGKIYAGAWGESLEDVDNTLRSVTQNIGTGTDSFLQKTGERVLDLTGTFDQEAAGVTRAVGQMLKTGLAKNADEAFDILTRGFQTGADKSEDFLDTLNEYGTQFRKLGIDGATATGLISQGLKAGARDGDLVADALKEFSIRAVDGSTTSAAAFKALGLNAKEMTAQIGKGGKPAAAGLQTVLDKLRAMSDPVKREAAAVGIFGTQAEDLGKALFSLDPSKAEKALGRVDGAAQRLSDTVNDNAATNFESFKRQVQQTFVNAIGRAVPYVDSLARNLAANYGPALKTAANLTKEFGVWLQKNQQWVVPLVAGLGTFAVVIKTITTATKIWTGAQIAINVALTANPIGLIIAGVAALVVGIVLAYKKSETFRLGLLVMAKAGAAAVRVLVDAFLGAAEWIVKGAAKAFGWVPGLGPKLKGAAKDVEEFRDQTNAKLRGIEDKIDVRINTELAQKSLDRLVATAKVMTSLTGGTISVSRARSNLAKNARATGGPVSAGQSYLVGEHRPEVFTPSTNGSINPRPASLRLPTPVSVPALGGAVRGGDGAAAPIVVQVVLDGRIVAESTAARVADRVART